MVDTVLQGKEPEINDTKTYNNEVKIVPSYLLTPHAVGKDDIQKLLVDSGYYQGRRPAVTAFMNGGPRELTCGAPCFSRIYQSEEQGKPAWR